MTNKNKLKDVEILRRTVLIVFIIFCFIGVIILIFFDNKLDAYGSLVKILLPIFLSQVVPAMLGKAIADYSKNKKEDKQKDIEER